MKRATEREMIRRSKDGDREALEWIWRAHRPWVAVVLLAHRPREADLEDLLQEVAATLVARVHELRDSSRLRGWLRTVALNVARGAGTRARRERQAMASVAPESLEVADPREVGPEATAEIGQELEQVMTRVAELPPEYREPLLLRAVRGLGQKDIAELLDVPITTVETRLARGRRMLREMLGAKIAR